MKGVLAGLSGSLAVTAATIDSATDSIASLAVYAGLKLSKRKTRHFPLGLYKIENVISVIIALFIFFAGYEIARHIVRPALTRPDISLTVIAWLFAGTVLTFLFGQIAVRVGKRTGSPTLQAEGRHRQADVLSSLVVLVSVVMDFFGIRADLFGFSIDQITAALVLLFVAHAGWSLLSDGMRVLLDASIDFETLDQVKKIITSEPTVTEVRSLVGRNAGRYRFLQADVVLRTENLERAHQISEKIETKIRRQVPHVERVSIHFEPRARKHARIAIPLERPDGRISAHFGEAPCFALYFMNLAERRISRKDILTNPHNRVKKAKGIRVAEWLVEKNVDELVVREEDILNRGPGYMLSSAGVEIHVISHDDPDEAVDALMAAARGG
jgi:cation diffusion facilitator family transporter